MRELDRAFLCFEALPFFRELVDLARRARSASAAKIVHALGILDTAVRANRLGRNLRANFEGVTALQRY